MPESRGPPDERHEPEPATLAAFLLLVLLAGGNAPAIRYVSCDGCELDPFWGAAIRFALAGAIFAVVSAGRGLPRGRALAGAAVFGALQFGVGFAFIYWGLVHAPAGLTQVLLACVPLFTFALALAQRQERFRLEGLVGAALAVAGIAVVFGSGFDTGVPPSSMVATLAGAVCWAEALVVVKAFPGVHPAAMNAVAMAVGAVILLALSVLSREAHGVPEDASTLTAQAYLVFAGSFGVFWLYVFVAQRWSASAASYQLVLIPLVTVVVSAWLQEESITPAFAAGSALVLLGVYVGTLRRPAIATPGEASPE